MAIIALDTLTGSVSRITPSPPNCGSWQLLDVRHDVIIAAHSSPTQPPRLMCARRGGDTWIWEGLHVAYSTQFGPDVEQALQELHYSVIQVPYPTGNASEGTFEAVVMHNGTGPRPTVLVPHGGPHSASTTTWLMTLAFACSQGYNIVLPNYRGSTGFGDGPLQTLPGVIGTQDVVSSITGRVSTFTSNDTHTCIHVSISVLHHAGRLHRVPG